ncbi:MAG: isoleucyl-tRNA synthetase [Chloroflexi bacterium]|nr:MAG: isoleucyl-tRNA synthetase [Chloroflexota bacterium]
MFKSVSSKVNFITLETDIKSWWNTNKVMEKYLTKNDGSSKRFSFIDGPITANNRMGVHHAWGRTYKDLYQRFKTMQGYKQRYQNGFDGQGLWIEVEVEKELGFKSKKDIESFGIDKFVEMCKQRVLKFSDIQTEQSKQLAYWMDWDNSYHTMSDENNYTIWHFLKRCHEKGWLYEGTDVMPWCPRCGTGLSEHEIVTEGYQEIVHPGLFVRFPLYKSDNEIENIQNCHAEEGSLLIWTTTPWTLSSNIAAAVNPKLTYVKVLAVKNKKSGEKEILYLAKGRVKACLKGEFEVLNELKGSELIGKVYSAPFGELPVQQGIEHRVIEWGDVSEDEGTGIVHIAPGAGKEDFALSKSEKLPVIAPLDDAGVFIDGFDWLTGKSVYEVNEEIFERLKSKGVFYRLEKYKHRYPVCWRCNSELVFRLVNEWFISMKDLRHRIAEVTKNIQWIPSFGLQRELDWLKNMDDWMVSKKRYWGLALPIYKCECGNFDVIGSEIELKERSVSGWSDFDGKTPHRPWVDFVQIACSSCGRDTSRIKDVGNPWLDAGIVPFSTLGYRNDRTKWQEWFPADWISESFPGQFRNWFYSLLTMSTVLEDTEPTKAIFSYALMRDGKGAEMHKSKGNAIWFEDAAEKMGVDAMRWLYSRQHPATNLNFSYQSTDEVRRQFMIPLWNIYSFFVTYAKIDGYNPYQYSSPEVARRPELDQWIISELNQLIAETTLALDSYDSEKATLLVETFVDYLSNWYVRRSRRRFWKSGELDNSNQDKNFDKVCAYTTLYECLVATCKLIAPIMPHMSESIYQNLIHGEASVNKSDKRSTHPLSVHLCEFPQSTQSLIDEKLSSSVRLAMKLSSLGRAARSKVGLKVRQPAEIALVTLKAMNENALLPSIEGQIRDELNVKRVEISENDKGVLDISLMPNLPVLGKKYGAAVRDIKSSLASMEPFDVYRQVKNGERVSIKGFVLEPEEIIVNIGERQGYSVSSDGGYAVAIKTDLTKTLIDEGVSREVVHQIQNMRKSAGFNISDHIVLKYSGNVEIEEIIKNHIAYVTSETLADDMEQGIPPTDFYSQTLNMEGKEIIIGIKVSA